MSDRAVRLCGYAIGTTCAWGIILASDISMPWWWFPAVGIAGASFTELGYWALRRLA